MNPVLFVIADVIADDTPQVSFVQRDHVIEELSAATSDPSFCGPVLAGRPDTSWLWLQPGCFQEGADLAREGRIAIQDDIAIRTCFRKGFPQLLHHPVGRRVSRGVEVQNSAAPMLDYKEAVQMLKVAVGTVKKSSATMASRWL